MQETAQIQEREIVKMKDENSKLVAHAESIAVLNQMDFENASAHLKTIQTALKNIEAKRLSFTKPLNESLKNINDTFKLLKLPLEQAKDIISGKMQTWHHEERKRIEAEQEKIRKEELRRMKIRDAHREKGHNVSDEEIALEQPEPLNGALGASHIRKRWVFRIVDESKVPQKYYSIDETKIRQAVAEGAREIPGILIYQDESVVTR